MKFGKRLQKQIEETLPEWRDKFLCYKVLKKQIKAISSAMGLRDLDDVCGGPPPPKRARVSVKEEESTFTGLLNDEIDKFNMFFVEQEEEYIIRQKVLQDRIRSLQESREQNSDAEYSKEMLELRKDIVNLHGEMVLLQNYSSLNYIGVTKILKKYDKRTGGLLRHPFIQQVLEQPFFTTDQLSNLIRECENTLQNLFTDCPLEESSCSTDTNGKPSQGSKKEKKSMLKYQLHSQSQSSSADSKQTDAATITDEGATTTATGVETIQRSIVSALHTLREIRKGSSTYSVFSLPPLPTSTSSGGGGGGTGEDMGDETKKAMPVCSLIPICP